MVLLGAVKEVAPKAGLGGTSAELEAKAAGTGAGGERAPVAGATRTTTDLRSLGPAFPRYLFVLLLFTLGNASDAFLLLRAQDLGVSAAAIPLLWGAFHVSKMIWNVPGGMLADRFRPLPMILAGWLVYALVYGGFAVAGTTWQVWALFSVYGLFYGLTESPEKALVAQLAPSQLRGRAFGVFHFAVGLGAFPASLLFGALWTWKGAPAAFTVGAAFALVAALLLPLALRGAFRGAGE
jgi:sugar phosphate permease